VQPERLLDDGLEVGHVGEIVFDDHFLPHGHVPPHIFRFFITCGFRMSSIMANSNVRLSPTVYLYSDPNPKCIANMRKMASNRVAIPNTHFA
jgi:hypothetical protein